MPPSTTHLVIGERIFPHLPRFDQVDYGGFLLGCVLVDVHGFSAIDRRSAHFADRLDKDSDFAFDRSCINFLSQLDGLLIRPWDALTSTEQAFVTGYLCHLAADEEWKRFDWYTLNKLGLYLWTDLSVPGDVLFTAFDILSNDLYVDFASVASALRDAVVPTVFLHVSHNVFQVMWDIIKAHVINGSTLESVSEIHRRLGKTNEGVQAVRQLHEEYWQDAEWAIKTHFGGIERRIQAMVQHSLATMALLSGSRIKR